MKNLLLPIFLLTLARLNVAAASLDIIPLTGQGQNSSVTTASGTVLLTGATTNEYLYVTNYQNVVKLDNTNQIIVYSVGDTASRGTYVFKTTVNGIGQFTNTLNNGKTLAWDRGNADFGLDYPFAITNGAVGVGDTAVQYGQTGTSVNPPSLLPAFASPANGATAPGGFFTWGTNFVTNVFSIVIATPLSLPDVAPSDSATWWITPSGNDQTAQRGRRDLPAASIYRVFTNLSAGDIVRLSPGHHSSTNFGGNSSLVMANTFTLPSGVKIYGSGEDVTFIDGTVNVSQWYLGNSNTLAHFTSTNVWFYDAIVGKSTNLFFQDIKADATGDVIVFQGGAVDPVIDSCDLGGNSDKIADLSSGSGANGFLTNSVITVRNTRVRGGTGANNRNGLNSSGPLRWKVTNLDNQCTGKWTVEHSITNANWGSFIFAPDTIRTNFISGALYTNGYSESFTVKGTPAITAVAGTAGTALLQLWVYQQSGSGGLGTTNQAGFQTTASTVAFTNASGTIVADVPPGYVYTFTNRSVGGGNSATILDGQIRLY